MAKADKRKGRKAEWYEPASLKPVKLDDRYIGQPTGFETDDILDYAFWLDEEQRRSPALRAIIEAEATGDDRSVAELLRSGAVLSAWDQSLLRDHAARNKAGKPGRKAIPAYARSEKEAGRLLALARAKHLQGAGLSRDQAFKNAAKEFGIRSETLHNFALGKIGSARRMKKRRSAPS